MCGPVSQSDRERMGQSGEKSGGCGTRLICDMFGDVSMDD